MSIPTASVSHMHSISPLFPSYLGVPVLELLEEEADHLRRVREDERLKAP